LVKTETLITVKPRRTDWLRANGIDGLLELIFYKNPDLIRIARAFLEEIKRRQRERTPYPASDWKEYLKEQGITHSNYFSVVGRLCGAGLLRRERGYYYVSRDFSTFLSQMEDVWNAWLSI